MINRALRRQKGTVAIIVAASLTALAGFSALAIDVGRIWVVRNELQNAADAAALAGASVLSAYGQLTVQSNSNTWSTVASSAAAAVSTSIGKNVANGLTLSTASVLTGYWNVAGQRTGAPSTSATPGTVTPGTNYLPAVQVTVGLSGSGGAGVNGGALKLLLAPVFGATSVPISATATAAISAPGSAKIGALFPMALPACLLQNPAYWNSTTGQPVNTEVSIGDVAGCIAGVWASFPIFNSSGNVVANDSNNVPTVNGEIQHNTTPVAIGQNIWLEPGAKASIYKDAPVGTTVVMPLVSDNDLTVHSSQQVVGYAAFHIDSANQGQKTIRGHFVGGVENALTPGAGGGQYYGATTPPMLVQ